MSEMVVCSCLLDAREYGILKSRGKDLEIYGA